MSEVNIDRVEMSDKERNVDKILFKNPRYKQILDSHIGTKLTNRLIRQIGSFSVSKEVSKQEVKKLFDELVNKIDSIDRNIWTSFFDEIKKGGEKWMLPWFWYKRFKWLMNEISQTLEKQQSETSNTSNEIHKEILGLLDIKKDKFNLNVLKHRMFWENLTLDDMKIEEYPSEISEKVKNYKSVALLSEIFDIWSDKANKVVWWLWMKWLRDDDDIINNNIVKIEEKAKPWLGGD